jgi:NAD-dependent dihydropyrimidine dehydrogenase PreA subunit
MKRARLNLLIDAVTGCAFLVAAVTGVVFLLPLSWQQVLLIGLSIHAWHWLHDWSGVVAAAGVALHLALHWRWVANTAGGWMSEARGETRDRRAATLQGASSRVAAADRSPEERHDGQRAGMTERERRTRGRLTRRGFLVGAAGLGAALVGGVTLARIASAVGTDHTTDGGAGRRGPSAAAGSSAGGTAAARAGRANSTGATTTTAPRVVVDSSRCKACGRCIQVCPKSVFAWNSAGRSTARSPDSCNLCRRCVQVCPASAITLNA